MKQPKTINNTYRPTPSTIELFSWQYLMRHPRTKAITERYFGTMGKHLYQNNNKRTFSKQNTSEEFRAEINAINPSELCDRDIFNTDADFSSEAEIRKFLYGQPYYLMLSEDEFELAVAIIFLIRKNLRQLRPGDQTLSFFSSPTLWQDAMIYIRYLNQRIWNLSPDTIQRGRDALAAYRASYLLDKLGLERTCNLVQNFFDVERFQENSGKFYEFINEILGEDLAKKFSVQTKPKIIDLDSLDFENLFRYPDWLEFTPATQDEIIRRILADEMEERDIDYYLGVSEAHENYVKLFPAICKVIRSTKNPHLLWTAGDVLNLIWKNLPEDPEIQKWMRHQIYDLYWPRINSVWPVEHYNDFDFKDESERRIFDDALNWVMCLDDITKQSTKLKGYLMRLSHQDFDQVQKSTPSAVWKRVFNIKFQRLDTRHKFKAAWENLDTYDAWRYLSYPNTIKEADLVLNKIIDNLDTPYDEAAFGLEQLLLSGNLPKVGAYIISYLNESYDRFWLKFGEIADDFLSFFTAACSGASEKDEAEPLEKLAEKYRVSLAEFPLAKEYIAKVDLALKQAKQQIKDFQREQANLAKNLVANAEKAIESKRRKKQAEKAVTEKTAEAEELTESTESEKGEK